MTATITEIDIMSLIDWESEIACTADPCENAASWRICPPCGDDFELCDECKEWLVDEIKKWKYAGCKTCGKENMDKSKVLFRRI